MELVKNVFTSPAERKIVDNSRLQLCLTVVKSSDAISLKYCPAVLPLYGARRYFFPHVTVGGICSATCSQYAILDGIFPHSFPLTTVRGLSETIEVPLISRPSVTPNKKV